MITGINTPKTLFLNFNPTLHNVVIECPASSRSGYGDKSREIVLSLIESSRKNKFNLFVVDTRWGNCSRTALSEDTNNNNLIKEYIVKAQLPIKTIDIYFKVGLPTEIRKVGKKNILITSLVETTLVHSNWLININEVCDMVIVPSQFSKEVLTKSIYDEKDNVTGKIIRQLKCEKPVEVISEGFNENIFYKIQEAEMNVNDDNIVNSINDIPEKFNFLFVGHWLAGGLGNDRKDVGMLVKTFYETFINVPNDKRPGLILKTSSATFSVAEREDIINRIKTIHEIVRNGRDLSLPNVYFLHGDFNEDEMNLIYNHPKVKAMVSFTHGEGFGRPLLEFGVTGKPIVTTNWSGHLDFLSKNGILLAGELQPVSPEVADGNIILKESCWYNVNYLEASKNLFNIWSNYSIYLKKSFPQSSYVINNFNLEILSKKWDTLVMNNLNELPKEKPFVMPELIDLNKV